MVTVAAPTTFPLPPRRAVHPPSFGLDVVARIVVGHLLEPSPPLFTASTAMCSILWVSWANKAACGCRRAVEVDQPARRVTDGIRAAELAFPVQLGEPPLEDGCRIAAQLPARLLRWLVADASCWAKSVCPVGDDPKSAHEPSPRSCRLGVKVRAPHLRQVLGQAGGRRTHRPFLHVVAHPVGGPTRRSPVPRGGRSVVQIRAPSVPVSSRLARS